jgi:hypothetical protein
MEKRSHKEKPGDENARSFELKLDLPQLLYGPPNLFNPSNNMAEGIYGPPKAFFPADNENEDLYGPPSFFGGPEEEPVEEPADENGVPEQS